MYGVASAVGSSPSGDCDEIAAELRAAQDSPAVQKMAVFGRPRLAVVLHCAVAVLVTLQVTLSCGQDVPFVVASRSTFAEAFLAAPVRRTGPVSGSIHTAEDCMASVSHVIRTFFSLAGRGLDTYEEEEDSVSAPTAWLRVTQYQMTPRELIVAAARPQTSELEANVTGPQQDWLARLRVGPGRVERRLFFARMVQMRLELPLTMVHRELDHFQLFTWNIVVDYDFESRGGQIQVRLEARGSHGGPRSKLNSLHWELVLDSLLALVAAGALLSECAAGDLPASSASIACASSATGTGPLPWRRLGQAADVCVLVGACLDAAEQAEALGLHSAVQFHFPTQLSVGLGCLLSWTRLMQHMSPTPAYDQILETFRRGVPVVLRFVFSLLPLLIGFASLGVALFSELTPKFASIDASFFTLFAVMNGDVVLDTIDSVRQAGIVGPAYLISFVMLFIWVALSITISIIQDSYWAAKRGGRRGGRAAQRCTPSPTPTRQQQQQQQKKEPSPAAASPTRALAGGDTAGLMLLAAELRDTQRRTDERLRLLERALAAAGGCPAPAAAVLSSPRGAAAGDVTARRPVRHPD